MIAYRIEMTATGHVYGRATYREPKTIASLLSVSGMFGQGMTTPECVGMYATHLWCEDRNVPTGDNEEAALRAANEELGKCR